MPFTLRVDFSGLCMYVRHSDGQHVAVLLPDCRKSTNPVPKHFDTTDAEPHVGYVRLDFERLGLGLVAPAPAGLEPRYELVHRFTGQMLKFEGTPTQPDTIDTSVLDFPSFDHLGFPVDLVSNLFSAGTPTDPPVPPQLLARMVLRGGRLSGRKITGTFWEFPQVGDPASRTYAREYASFATWTRGFDGNALTVRITNWAGTPEASFPINNIPDGAEVVIKVANLCCSNPLEWNDLPLRTVKGPDEDFKWLYRLVIPHDTPPTTSPEDAWKDLLNGTRLPHPRLVPGPGSETGSDDCIAVIKEEDFPV